MNNIENEAQHSRLETYYRLSDITYRIERFESYMVGGGANLGLTPGSLIPGYNWHEERYDYRRVFREIEAALDKLMHLKPRAAAELKIRYDLVKPGVQEKFKQHIERQLEFNIFT